MGKRFYTVKNRVIVMMVSFAVIITLSVLLLSFYMIDHFQGRTSVQSAEFNLQLISSVIEQDLIELTALAKWCSTSTQITNYYLKPQQDAPVGLLAYDRVREQYNNSRSFQYVHRLLITNSDADRILQVGNTSNAPTPITKYTIHRLFEGIEPGSQSEWGNVILDPFMDDGSQYLLLHCPVYSPADRSPIGTVYLTVSTSVITDKLKGYSLTEDSSLYIRLGGQGYRIDNGRFTPVAQAFPVVRQNTEDPTSPDTVATVVRTPQGRENLSVSYPVREGIWLTQLLSAQSFNPLSSIWGVLLVGQVLLILLLALAVTFSLDRGISRPLIRLHAKVDAIAAGNFSPDPEIARTDDEIGAVGRGINRMAGELAELMESRIADSRRQQDLEYRMLQSQINPHFIYNTLGSIKWMAVLQNAEGIAEMTTALSRLLKTVAKDIRKVVPLREELALLDDYFLIQQYRYGGAVTLEKQVEDEHLLACEIPRFALQPLMENAIFHGIEPKGAGHVRLYIRREGGDALVSITDDGVGMSREVIDHIFSAGEEDETDAGLRQLGVRSVHDRIRYAFGEGYGLCIQSEPGHYTTMTLRLPFRSTPNMPQKEVQL